MWTAEPVDGIDAWDPDAEPTRHGDGRGHALLELYARLRARGHAVTIGPRPAAGASCAVVFAKDLDLRTSLTAARRLAGLPVVVIESDWPRWRRLPLHADLLVRSGGPGPVPGAATSLVDLPLLPQRGLVPRSGRGQVRTVGFMGSPDQVPEFWSSAAFRAATSAVGVAVLEPRGAGVWHDFGDVDVALCMRRSGLATGHKPPTKLVNAWAAGAIPLVGDEPSSRSLGIDGEDCLFVDDETAVVAALGRLTADADLVARIEAGLAGRAITTDSVLDRWESALFGVSAEPRRRRHMLPMVRSLVRWVAAQSRNVVVNRHPPTDSGALVRSGG